MFSFHKPKIYRSISGCCICKAKSSSSRFTDSKKYEAEFEKCFCITSEKRSGEICNACVLLVKRWKKLPPGTVRDWRHVVDARAGPGTKSLKNAKSNSNSSTLSAVSNSQKKVQKPKRAKSSSTAELNENGEGDSNGDSLNRMSNLGIESDSSEDMEDEEDDYLSDYDESDSKRKLRTRNTSNINKSSLNTAKHSSKRNNNVNCDGGSTISSFLDMSFWRKEKICCGIIFKGPDNEVLLYPKLLKPCSCRINAMQRKMNGSNGSTNSTTGVSSDNSSVASASPLEDDANSNASSSNNFNII